VEVAFVPPQTDVVRRARVAAVHEVDGHSAEVEFEGVDGAAAAELVGCHCLIRRRGIPPEAFEEQPALWDGWTVVDADEGLVGTVTDVIDNPGQVLLALDRADGKGELLVPAVDDIVLDVDVDACEVRVALPKGLLDL
jgi:16S rRNA processing protein RimM